MHKILCTAVMAFGLAALPARSQGVISFQSWTPLPNGVTATGLGGASFGGNIHLFAVGIDDRKLYENIKYGATSWRGWQPVDDIARTDAAPAAVTFSGQLFLFHKGMGGVIYVSRKSSSHGPWSTWEPVPGLTTNVAPFAVVYLGRIHLVAVRAGVNDILLSRYPEPVSFSAWMEIPGGGRTRQAVGGTVYQDYVAGEGPALYLYVSGLDNTIWHQKYSTLSGWRGWMPFGGSTMRQVTSASVMRPAAWGGPPDSRYRYQALFHKGLDDKPYLNHRGFDIPDWFGFFPMGAGALTKTPITPVVHNNQIYAYIAGGDTRIYEAIQYPLRPYPY